MNMKKRFLVMAMAGVALAGCVSEDVSDVKQKDEKVKIAFESPVLYNNVNSRVNVYGEIGSHKYDGSETVYSYPRDEEFTIFAVEHVGNLTSWTSATACEFNGKAITYNPSLDAWAPLKDGGGFYYWPDGELLSFAAVSPANFGLTGVVPSYGANGLTIENFTVNDNPAYQYDLLFSKRAVNQSASLMIDGAEYYSGIPIVFQHALTSIHFSLKKESNVTETVTLTGITVKNVKNKGSFNEKITNETVYASQPSWGTPTGSANYTSFSGSVEFPLNPKYVSALAAEDGTDDGDVSHPLLLMPQNLADETIVEITYYVGSEEKTKTIQLNQYPSSMPISAWEIGTRYTYRLYYGKASEIKDIIYFSPSTENWKDGGIIEVLL